ncbi:hypothetical protein LWI29_024054 [Acer saccharum]|uniref:PGG domain-containing protein n=1 Tax=Acer saccharum TaxID=4024 RepID=A0AA39TCN1_ACESA|nr:hypothetical protein LWI29_024054 [Acer saccharum]
MIAKKLIIEDKSAACKADNQGKTALHVAAGLGRVTIMRELISSCPGCCELVDNRGWNVLHFASTSRNSNAIKLILRNPSLGNLVNEKDEKGNTPFLQAASMHFIINHPKVDNLVFNNDNHNAADILVNPLTHIYPWKLREFISWHLIKLKIIRCRRFMLAVDNNEGVKEDKGDSVLSSNSKGNGNVLVVATLSYVVFNYLFLQPHATHTRQLIKLELGRKLLTGYAMLAMIGAFLAGTCAVLYDDKKLAFGACAFPVAFILYFRMFCVHRMPGVKVK